jgi:hypothetical protein
VARADTITVIRGVAAQDTGHARAVAAEDAVALQLLIGIRRPSRTLPSRSEWRGSVIAAQALRGLHGDADCLPCAADRGRIRRSETPPQTPMAMCRQR